MPRAISKEIIIQLSDAFGETIVAPKVVFDALITPSAIRKWWGASCAVIIPEKDGVYDIVWGETEDDPDFITTSRIIEIDSPNLLVLKYGHYYAKSGKLPFEAEFIVTFKTEPAGEAIKLTVREDGFPDDSSADEFYQGCVAGWEEVLKNIKAFCSSPQPPSEGEIQ